MKAPRILLPSGIGDIHWVLVKLQAFIQALGCPPPELWIADDVARRRSLEFLRLVPWVVAGGYQPMRPASSGPFICNR